MITKNKILISCVNLFKKDLRAKHRDKRYTNVGLSYSSTNLINLNIIEDKN